MEPLVLYTQLRCLYGGIWVITSCNDAFIASFHFTLAMTWCQSETEVHEPNSNIFLFQYSSHIYKYINKISFYYSPTVSCLLVLPECKIPKCREMWFVFLAHFIQIARYPGYGNRTDYTDLKSHAEFIKLLFLIEVLENICWVLYSLIFSICCL